jgi:biotin carboxyl carrier protein
MKITLNGIHRFEITKDSDYYLVDGSAVTCNIQRIDNDSYQVILNNQTFIASVSKSENRLEIKIGHHTHLVDTCNESQSALEKIGITQKKVIKNEVIKAPMPGLIIDIFVREGAKVKTGQAILVLKAMKMENIIKSPQDGVIKALLVNKDQKIDKDTPMFHF